MSSTKITEFDLDPNMDMAHESTSQEILEKVGTLNPTVDGRVIKSVINDSIVTATTYTLLNVTGSGKFMGAYMYSSAAGSKNEYGLVVTIDGVDYVCKCKTSSASSGDKRVIFVPQGSYTTADDGAVCFNGIDSGVPPDLGANVGTVYSTSQSSVKPLFLFDECLPFKESLKITVTTLSTTVNQAYAWYTLED